MHKSLRYTISEEEYTSIMTQLLLQDFQQVFDGELHEKSARLSNIVGHYYSKKVQYCTNFSGKYMGTPVSVSLRHHCFTDQKDLQYFEVLVEGSEARRVAAYVLGIIEAFRSLLLQTSN